MKALVISGGGTFTKLTSIYNYEESYNICINRPKNQFN